MTKADLEARAAEIQGELNTLGMDLITKNQKGIQLLTEQELVAKRIADGDYSITDADLEMTDDPIGEKIIDNDQ